MVTRRRVLTTLSAGLLGALAAPLAARDLPLDGKPRTYVDGRVEAIHVPSGLPVTDGLVAALLHPDGYHGKPARVIVTLSGLDWPCPTHRPYLRPVYPHRTPWVAIGEDGRFVTARMSLSPPFGGSPHWERARLEGRVTQWGG